MLEKAVIRNFQSHKKLVVHFDPQVTTIVGRSDVGKSAIIRALKWLMLNTPAGDDFRRSGQKFVSVRLFVDGHQILRKRGKQNLYELDGRKYVAFGATVPQPVADLLNVSEINYQGQFSPPYWVSDTPGQISRNLNAIINLGVIDTSLSNIASSLRKASSEVDLTQERLQSAKAARKSLDWVEEYSGSLGKLEKQEVAIVAKRARIDAVASAIDKLEKAQAAARNALPAIQDGLAALKAGRRLKAKQEQVSKLEELISALTKEEDRRCQLESAAKVINKKLAVMTKGTCPVCGKMIS